MATLSIDALEDAHAALRTAGREAGEFTFVYVPYPRLGCGAGPPVADVIVTNTATGVRHIYPAGPTSNWLARFSEHVAAGVYWVRS